MIKIVDICIGAYSWSANLTNQYEADINNAILDMKKEGYLLHDLQLIPPMFFQSGNTDYTVVPPQDYTSDNQYDGKILMIFKGTDLRSALQGM